MRCPALILLLAIPFAAAAGPASQPAATQPTAECLSGNAARAALVDDHLDPYFATMTPAEMAAKTGGPIAGDTPAARLADCLAKYQQAVSEFTPDERAALDWYVSKIDPPIARDYPVFGHQRWSFIRTADTLEGGMPYTRGPHIILPKSIVSRLVFLKNHMGDRAIAASIGILVHEQTHVVQRLHPDLFAPLYTTTFHFVHAKRVEPNDWLHQRQLENPDGIACDWVMPVAGDDGRPAYVLPLIAFDRPDPPQMIPSLTMIAVDVEPVAGQPGVFRPVAGGDGTPKVRPLAEVDGYTAVAGAGGNNYHPNEICADAFARLVAVDDFTDPKQLADRLGPDRAKKLEASNKPIRDWAKAAFAENR